MTCWRNYRLDPARDDNAIRAARYRRHVLRRRIKAWLNSDAGQRWLIYPVSTVYAPICTVYGLIFAAIVAALAYSVGN